MTEEINEAIKKRNELRKNVREKRTEWIEASRSVSKMIKEEKDKQWKEFGNGLSSTTKEGKVWSTIRNLDGRYPPTSKN